MKKNEICFDVVLAVSVHSAMLYNSSASKVTAAFAGTVSDASFEIIMSHRSCKL